jgi:hypothetical protein
VILAIAIVCAILAAAGTVAMWRSFTLYLQVTSLNAKIFQLSAALQPFSEIAEQILATHCGLNDRVSILIRSTKTNRRHIYQERVFSFIAALEAMRRTGCWIPKYVPPVKTVESDLELVTQLQRAEAGLELALQQTESPSVQSDSSGQLAA